MGLDREKPEPLAREVVSPGPEVLGFEPCGGRTSLCQGRDRTDLFLPLGILLGVSWQNDSKWILDKFR